jgi:hypothetical protein
MCAGGAARGETKYSYGRGFGEIARPLTTESILGPCLGALAWHRSCSHHLFMHDARPSRRRLYWAGVLLLSLVVTVIILVRSWPRDAISIPASPRVAAQPPESDSPAQPRNWSARTNLAEQKAGSPDPVAQTNAIASAESAAAAAAHLAAATSNN